MLLLLFLSILNQILKKIVNAQYVSETEKLTKQHIVLRQSGYRHKLNDDTDDDDDDGDG